MVRIPSPSRRNAGRLLVIIGVAAALPLTASHAIAYIDVPEAVAPVARALPATTTVTTTAVQIAAPAPQAIPKERSAAAPVARVDSDPDAEMTIDRDFVTIDGKTKRWEDLTPEEKTEVQRAVTKARTALATTHLNQAQITNDLNKANGALANVNAKMQIGQVQLELERAQAVAQLADTRHLLENPERIKANIAYSMAVLQSIDFDALKRSARVEDTEKLAATLATAEQSMRAAQAELDRIQARIDADPRK